MKTYKLIIADFDGTLAGRDGIISKTVEEAIRKWRKAGGDFSIATGRQYAMIQDEVDKLGITTPQITRGGAEIVDPKTGKVIY
ncbi:MAG: HAD family hydrolase, partial [Candidatus Levyibacteriota bacterium]